MIERNQFRTLKYKDFAIAPTPARRAPGLWQSYCGRAGLTANSATKTSVKTALKGYMTEKQIPKLAGIIVEHQAGFASLSTDEADWAIKNGHIAVALFVEAVKARVAELVKSVLQPLSMVAVPAIGKKKTADCFTNTERYYHRHNDLDNWLPAEQPAQKVSTFTVYRAAMVATFKEMAEDLLNTEGDTKELSRLIKERRLTTTLPVIGSLIERQERGEDVGLLTNGHANLFLTEDKDGGVLVVCVYRYGEQWIVGVARLDDDCRWDGVGRFFARN